VDDALGEPERRKGDITAIFGLGNSGGSNVAKYKHQYVAEAIEERKLRR